MKSHKLKRSKKKIKTGIVVSKPLSPSVFLPDCLAQVKMIAMTGATDDEIAERFGVEKSLFQAWKKAYPSFAKAISEGRSDPDIEVTQSLFKRAVGYDYKEDGLTRTGQRVPLKKHLPGDVHAIKFWMVNRMREKWGERQTTEVVGGPKGSNPVNIESRSQLIEGILALVQPKPDGDSKSK